jgi:hypothetical protein
VAIRHFDMVERLESGEIDDVATRPTVAKGREKVGASGKDLAGPRRQGLARLFYRMRSHIHRGQRIPLPDLERPNSLVH